jgi:hypothetical protein
MRLKTIEEHNSESAPSQNVRPIGQKGSEVIQIPSHEKLFIKKPQ